MDAATNGILLPDNAKGVLKDGPQIMHRGSHPQYSAEIGGRVDLIKKGYYDGLMDAKAARIEIRRLRMEYKKKLWTGDVPHTIVDGQKKLH